MPLKLSASEPGIVVSGLVHVTAVVLLLVAFSEAKPLDNSPEPVPVEMVTDAQFNEVMRGDKTVKDVVPNAPPKADKIAQEVNSKPDSPKPVAQRDVTPPPPPPLPPEPVKDETPPLPPQPVAPPPPVPQPPPRPIAAQPPPRPVPTPPPAPPAPTPPPRDVADAEPVAPAPPPPPKPKPPKVVEQKPVPRPEPKPVEAKLPPPPKPRPEKPKPDQLAKLLDQQPEDKPVHKAIARPKPAEEQPSDQHTFDLTDITRLLSHDAPSQTASTGRQISRVKVAGSETGAAQKMAASLWDQLDGLLEDQYKQCWSYLGLDGASKYIPQIKVLYSEDGGLMGEPVLINPPSDPAMRSLAESALRAVRRCNPLRIPAQYAPYYDQWKGRVLRFDPVDMAG